MSLKTQDIQDNNDVVDVLIVGGGPTGLFAAFYCGLRNASCRIIDSLPELGGRLTAVYPEKYIYDVAGFPKILAKDLVANLVQQVAPYAPRLSLGEQVESFVKNDQGVFALETINSKGHKSCHLGRTIILAAGVGTYSPKKHMAPGAKDYEDRGISYSVLDKEKYRHKQVLIAGGGDSALDWALELVALGATVTLVHRSDKFRAHDDSVSKLMASNARVLLGHEIIDFHGDDKHLKSVTLSKIDSDVTFTESFDDVLVMFGFNSSLGKMKSWGLELQGDGFVVNEKMETNIPGIYVAGDAANHSAKLNLIATGFSEAAIAANFAKSYLHPKEKVQPMHSTTLMEMKEKKAARKAD